MNASPSKTATATATTAANRLVETRDWAGLGTYPISVVSLRNTGANSATSAETLDFGAQNPCTLLLMRTIEAPVALRWLQGQRATGAAPSWTTHVGVGSRSLRSWQWLSLHSCHHEARARVPRIRAPDAGTTNTRTSSACVSRARRVFESLALPPSATTARTLHRAVAAERVPITVASLSGYLTDLSPTGLGIGLMRTSAYADVPTSPGLL